MAKVTINPEDYPANPLVPPKAEPKKEERQKLQQVTKGKVTRRKQSSAKKALEAFVGDDVSDVKGYILEDVIIPAIKNVISDVVGGGIDMLLFGDTKARKSRSNQQRTVYNYSSIRDGERRDRRRDTRDDNKHLRYAYDDLIFDSKGDAEEVLDLLIEHIEQFGDVSVADLNDLVGVSGAFTDGYWGWTDLSRADLKRVHGGWMLVLPRVVNLK